VIAYDGEYADTVVVSVTVTAVNDPPVVTSPSTAAATEDELFSYTATASDTDNVPSISFDDIPSWMDTSGSQISGTPTEGIGDTSFSVIAYDGQYADTVVVSVTVTAVNDPPVVTSPSTAAATEDEMFSYTATASDTDNVPLVSFDDIPSWLDTAGVVISGRPTEGIGDTSFSVIAYDGQYADTVVVSVTVTAVNDTPVIVSSPVGEATEGQLYSYQVQAVDVDNSQLVFSLPSAPAGMVIELLTGLITWTPGYADVGEAAVTVRVVDPLSAEARQEFTVSVAERANTAPEIASLHDTTVTAGELLQITVTAYDPDAGETIEYSLLEAPPGMTIDAGAGLIEYQAESDHYGSWNVVVRALDSRGGTDTDTFGLYVDIPTSVAREQQSTAEVPEAAGQIPFVVAPNPASWYDKGVLFAVSVGGRSELELTICDGLANIVHRSSHTVAAPAPGSGAPAVIGPWDLCNRDGRRVASGTYLAVARVKGPTGALAVYRTKIGVKDR
jgi:hypothetical protein